ncbi:MAG: tyrosine-type recombinase/integrase [Candidatus Moraniibacteriota bacterium]
MEYISQFVEYLKERNLSPNTIKVCNNNLVEFWNFLGRRKRSIRKVERKEIKAFLFTLSEKNNQPITRRAKLITLRSFYKYLEDESLIKNNPTKNLPLPKVASKEPAFLQECEIRKILQTFKKGKDPRAEVAIRILVETGFRLAELTNLSVGDIDTKQKTVRVTRKGNIEQIVPINSGLARLIKSFVKGKNTQAPIIANRVGERMTQRRVAIMVQDYLKKAKVHRAGISAHSFRHSFCVRMLQKKVNLKAIQLLCGHRSISTTERYLHINSLELRKGVAMAEIV